MLIEQINDDDRHIYKNSSSKVGRGISTEHVTSQKIEWKQMDGRTDGPWDVIDCFAFPAEAVVNCERGISVGAGALLASRSSTHRDANVEQVLV